MSGVAAAADSKSAYICAGGVYAKAAVFASTVQSLSAVLCVF